MKKLLKSLGVLSLIIAILLPFAELPKVNAQEDNCETHLQNYMFLDESSPYGFANYDEDKGGYSTFGNFPYDFPEDDAYEVKVTNVSTSEITTSDQMRKYWALHSTITSYSAINDTYQYNDRNQNGKIFTSSNDYKYSTNTILLHGRWGRLDQYGNVTSNDITSWGSIEEGFNYSMQTVGGTDLIDEMNVEIDGAVFVNDAFSNKHTTNLADYFNSIINKEIDENPVWTDSLQRKFIPLKITRTIDNMSVLNDYTYGYKTIGEDSRIKYYVYSETDTTTVDKATKSYDAMRDYLTEARKIQLGEATENKYENNIKEISKNEYENLDFIYSITDNDGDWEGVVYYWPFVLNVEYTVCPVSNEETPTPENPEDPGDQVPVGEWSVKYNANVKDVTTVTNMPKNQPADIGTDITLDSKKPSRDDYTFKGWCKNKDGSGGCYNPGDKIESPEKTEIIELFADWGKTDTENPGKWGVMSYIIGFISVGLVAGGIYLISKKKNLFKQI